MYQIRRTTQFKKDVKRVLKRGKELEQLLTVVQNLAEGEPLDSVYLDHPLKGQYHRKRDCHLEPDWILTLCHRGSRISVVSYRLAC